MIDELDQLRLLADPIVGKCYMSYPEKTPTGDFAVLSMTSCIPEAVDCDGSEYITTYDINFHLYVDGSRWDAFGVAERLSALLSSYHIRRVGLSEAYSEASGRVHLVASYVETIDVRGATYMER